MDKLKKYSWPGNVRELENILERAFVLHEGSIIQASSFDLDAFTPTREIIKAEVQPTKRGSLHGRTLADIESQAIEETLFACGGDKKNAAKILGISLKTLYNKLKQTI